MPTTHEETYPCHNCAAPIYSVSYRNAGQQRYDAGSQPPQQHLCHRAKVTDYALRDLTCDEVLNRPSKPGVLYVVWEEENRGRVKVRSRPGQHGKDARLTQAEMHHMGFVRELRCYTEPLPEPTLDCEHGWLTPDGTLYPCEDYYRVGYSDHIRVGAMLELHLGVPDVEGVCMKLQGEGWIATPCWAGGRHDDDWRPTEAMRRTIEAYCAKHGHEVPRHLWNAVEVAVLETPRSLRRGKWAPLGS